MRDVHVNRLAEGPNDKPPTQVPPGDLSDAIGNVPNEFEDDEDLEEDDDADDED